MNFKKIVLVVTCVISIYSIGFGQQTPVASQPLKTPPVDVSPMDMTYFPSGYAQLKGQGKTPLTLNMRLIYSRPQKKGREIFGKLIEYGKWWRMGANEATELDIFESVTIGGKKLEKGRYTLSCIPNENSWTIIVSSQTDIWGEGANKYDQKNDIVRLDVPVEKLTEDVEVFSMGFMKTEKGANILVAWERVKVLIPVTP